MKCGAQIWMLIFGHSADDRGDGRHLARQLLTPEAPAFGVPHLGNEDDGSLGIPAAVKYMTFPKQKGCGCITICDTHFIP